MFLYIHIYIYFSTRRYIAFSDGYEDADRRELIDRFWRKRFFFLILFILDLLLLLLFIVGPRVNRRVEQRVCVCVHIGGSTNDDNNSAVNAAKGCERVHGIVIPRFQRINGTKSSTE